MNWTPIQRRYWHFLTRAWFAGALLALAFLGASPIRSQTFVAEWAEADIGRVGPTGMAIDTVGGTTYLYAADQPHGRIIKIDVASGTRLAAWGQTGNGEVEFNSPYGVAIEPNTHDLYVAERGNDRVQRITNSGAFVMAFGGMGAGPGEFSSPIGIAADAAGNVYVVDHDNNRVEKFLVQQTAGSWTAQYVTAWGSAGSANGQFDAPYGLTRDAHGNIWVADGKNHRLQEFDANGNFLSAFGTYGTATGQFDTPTWVNFDAAGDLFVAETNSDPQNLSAPDLPDQRIQEFSPGGAFLVSWGAYGEAGGQFKLPFDVVLDGAGNAYVSDYYNTRIQKFALPADPPPSTSQFANVSTRLRTNASRPLIAGFVIAGNAPKQILVRAIGPTLTQFGVSGVLPNPSLQIYSGQSVVAQNDDWGGAAAISSAASAVGAFALPANSVDSALVVTLAPGAYTAQVGANGGDGIALVEVYDVDNSPTNRVVNLSTRGFVDTGDGVMVAGFYIRGSVPKKVLIRGVGPTLTNFGVTGTLADPVLKVYGPNTTLMAQDDDWETAQPISGQPAPATAAEISAAAVASAAFTLPAGSKDAAVVVSLPPGPYSAIVSGANNTTGTALVEVYEVPGQ